MKNFYQITLGLILALILAYFLFKGFKIKFYLKFKQYQLKFIFRLYLIVFGRKIHLVGRSGNLLKQLFSKKKKNKEKGGIDISWWKLLSNKERFTDMELKCKIGSENPAATAMIYGLLVPVFSWISAFFNHSKESTQNKFILKPIFHKNRIKVVFVCIFYIKIGEIINILLGKKFKKGSGIDVTTSN